MAERQINIEAKATVLEGGGVAVAIMITNLPSVAKAVSLAKALQKPIRDVVIIEMPDTQFFARVNGDDNGR